MSINSRAGRTDTAVRAGIAARLAEIQTRADNATDGPWDYPEKILGLTNTTVFVADRSDGVALVKSSGTAEFIAHARTDVPALTNAVESLLDYVDRCEESGITMQPGDVRRLVAAALGGAS